MSLCDRNLSLGIFSGFDPTYADIDGDRVTGVIGTFYDRLFMTKTQR